MPKTIHSKIYLYDYDQKLALGFKRDVENFLEQFEKLKSLSYEDFASVWKMRNFTWVFSGQKYALLLKELCENYFYVVKKFIMFPRSVYTQIGAFYLLYGLYYKQPLKDWVKIRLTLEEYQQILSLIDQMREQAQYDAVFIFAKMKTDQAFVYTAQRKPLGPDDRFVKSYQLYYDDTFNATKTESVLARFQDIVTSDALIADLAKTNDEYQEKMKKYAERNPNLKPFKSTLMDDLREAHKMVEEGPSGLCKIEEQEVLDVQNVRRRIREKALKNKNAVYRGNRTVKTAQDDDMLKRDSSSDE